jgi:putative GTP pyrophosphokinase
MNRQDLKRASYLFEGIKGQLLPENLIDTIRSFIAAENLYSSAAREIATKLENLNNEFNSIHERNPIHLIQTRVKTPASIVEKLKRRGCELSVESARKNLTDIAGVRVICSYINDIYMLSGFLLSQSDIQLVRTTDYIKNPKTNGYRSLHHIVKVPVFLSDRVELVNVEIQIRTIAMDFWASLEHELAYKLEREKSEEAFEELKACAAGIADIDRRMQKLYDITTDEIRP